MKKAIVLAGGSGTRMRPATLNINKHLLPLYSNEGAVPMIHYPIKTLVKSGIEDILIISSREHCGKIIENLGNGNEFNVNFTYKIQDTNYVYMGIASALSLAEKFTGRSSFAVILGDNFYENDFKKEFESFSRGGADASIFLKEVENPNKFGVFHENFIEEKPKEPKSKLAVTGLYLYTNKVYQVIKNLNISERGEMEITDVNNYFCQSKSMRLNFVEGFWGDMGTPKSLKKVEDHLNNMY
jgi:glucose-1-phosphate thymidylyltransferase